MIPQRTLTRLTRHNDPNKLPIVPISYSLGETIYNVATDGISMLVVPSDGQVWTIPEETTPRKDTHPSMFDSAMHLATALTKGTVWTGTIDALLLKEMAGVPCWDKDYMGQAYTNSPTLGIDGGSFSMIHLARVLHWWTSPFATLGRYLWDGVPTSLGGKPINPEKWKALSEDERRAETQAIVLAAPGMTVALACTGRYREESTYKFPEDAYVRGQFAFNP